MRRAARTDENQPAIVAALEAIGARVQILSAVGGGCPDLLVGHRGVNWLLEIKNPTKPKTDRQWTPEQALWHATWQGQVRVVETEMDALGVVLGRIPGVV